jgi:hypothetical protein
MPAIRCLTRDILTYNENPDQVEIIELPPDGTQLSAEEVKDLITGNTVSEMRMRGGKPYWRSWHYYIDDKTMVAVIGHNLGRPTRRPWGIEDGKYWRILSRLEKLYWDNFRIEDRMLCMDACPPNKEDSRAVILKGDSEHQTEPTEGQDLLQEK